MGVIKNNNIVIIQSLLVAFFGDIRCINWGLTQGGFVGEGVMSLLYIVVVAFILLTSIFSLKHVKSNLSKYSIFLPLYLIFYYALTYIFIVPPVVSVSFFMIFTIAAFLIPHVTRVDAKLMLKAMIIFPAFAILRMDSVFASVVTWATRLPMDVSYGYLVPIAANIVFLEYYFKKESLINKIIMLLFSIINLIFLLQIILYGSRGPMLCIVLLICFLWCVNHNLYQGVVVNKARVRFIFMAGIFIVLCFIPLLSYLDNLLAGWGVEIDAISKMLYLQEADGDISNGRNSLNQLAWNGICESPLWGNGLDQFDNKYPGESYPHNFLLQIFYDGGVILGMVLLPIFMNIRRFFKNASQQELAVFSTFFFASVPGALFSQDLWCIPILWMFFGLVCTKSFVLNENGN